MEYVKSIIDRYKHLRSLRQLGDGYRGMYAFVGIGNHSTSNLYPVLSYLHVPLKYIGCKSHDKLPLIERAYPSVKATTSLAEILSDDEVKGVFVSIAPEAHFDIGIKVLESGKALFVEKPPCRNAQQLMQLAGARKKAGNPTVVVGLQKRMSPAMQLLKKELARCSEPMTYNLRYLTGAYPEGDALLDLFIHPLDYVTFLFGKAQVNCMEYTASGTMFLLLSHANATGAVELSTAYTWSDAQESLTINTRKGTYEMKQLNSITFKSKPATLLGVPLEKVLHRHTTKTNLQCRNEFVPTTINNQIVTQGYYGTLKAFVDAVEGKKATIVQGLEDIVDTYSLLDYIAEHR